MHDDAKYFPLPLPPPHPPCPHIFQRAFFLILDYHLFNHLDLTCGTHFTSINDLKQGKTAYLNRHKLECPTSQAMSYFHLQYIETYIYTKKIRYQYKCCKHPLPAFCSHSISKETVFNGYGGGEYILH